MSKVQRPMSEIRFQRETRAYDAFAKLLEQAKETQRLFEDAEVPVPPPLARMLGITAPHNGAHRGPRVHVSAMEAPARPPEAEDDWIWLPLNETLAVEIVLAVLRAEQRPISATEVAARVQQLVPGTNPGTVYNVGPRLEKAKIIQRDGEGWRLVNPSAAPVLFSAHLWGPSQVFQKYSLAAHRRMVILHLLRALPSGLQAMQIVEQLETCGLCKASANKDLVKADLEYLREQKKIRQVSNTRKWEVV